MLCNLSESEKVVSGVRWCVLTHVEQEWPNESTIGSTTSERLCSAGGAVSVFTGVVCGVLWMYENRTKTDSVGCASKSVGVGAPGGGQ